jgi:hypothetical protein
MISKTLFLGFILSLAGFITQATPDQIASGKDYWVDSEPDPEFANINARVNLGNLREIAHGIYDADLRWPLSFDARKHWKKQIPGLVLTPAHYGVDRERIICHQNQHFSFGYRSALYNGQGQEIKVKLEDPQVAQQAAEKLHADFLKRLNLTDTVSYGSDPRSLVCWAVAQKCRKQAFYWPPPPNLTPLNHSQAAENMRAKYNQQFVPDCSIKTGTL